MWLLEKLQTKTYKHGGYSTFYVTKPKLRKIVVIRLNIKV